MELSIKLFVSCKSKVSRLSNFFERFIENFYTGVGHSTYTIIAELFQSNRAVTININGPKLSLNEKLERFWQILVSFPLASRLNSTHELFGVNFSILIEICNLCNLLPQVYHHSLVFLVSDCVPVSFTL